MGICLCIREACTSENGPPCAPPRLGAGPGFARRHTAAVGTARGLPRRRGGPQPRPEGVSVPRGLRRRHRRQGPAAPHSRPTTRRTDRTEPIEPPPTPDPAFSLPSLLPNPRPPYPRLPPRHLDGPPPVSNQTPTHPSPPPLPRCRRPAPRPTSTRLGKFAPRLPGRSRKGGPAPSGGPPFLQSPDGQRKTGRGRGGGLVALTGETHRTKQMEGNTRSETARVATTASRAGPHNGIAAQRKLRSRLRKARDTGGPPLVTRRRRRSSERRSPRSLRARSEMRRWPSSVTTRWRSSASGKTSRTRCSIRSSSPTIRERSSTTCRSRTCSPCAWGRGLGSRSRSRSAATPAGRAASPSPCSIRGR
jgi:hypothetical protein